MRVQIISIENAVEVRTRRSRHISEGKWIESTTDWTLKSMPKQKGWKML